MIKNQILERIEAARIKIEKERLALKNDYSEAAGLERLYLGGLIDGISKCHEIVRLNLPDQDRLDSLIELIQNSMDGKPQPVQIQRFDLYSRVSFVIATAPRRYIVRLLQALHYFKNQLN